MKGTTVILILGGAAILVGGAYLVLRQTQSTVTNKGFNLNLGQLAGAAGSLATVIEKNWPTQSAIASASAGDDSPSQSDVDTEM